MKGFIGVIGSVILLVAASPALPAQSLTERAPGGPTIESARLGVAAPAVAAAAPVNDVQVQAPGRESAALMIVGGAAMLAGLVIGGGAGTAIAVGGALLGLYGLWMYVR